MSSITERELEALRTELHSIIDSNVDVLMQRILSDPSGTSPPPEYEYPFSTAPSLFKGRKPTAVIINGSRIAVKTWRQVYTEILRHCDAEKHDTLLLLRNKIAGRERVILSDRDEGMDFPIQLSDELFAEAKFDTEWLMRILKQILDAAGCDYRKISIILK